MKIEEIELEVERIKLQLKNKLNKNIYAYIIEISEEDFAIAYLSEPARITKMRIIDMLTSTQGLTSAGDLLVKSCIIKEVSDPRFLDEKAENDSIYLALITNVVDLIQVATSVKKK